MTATADQVWAECVLRVYGTSLYPAALRMTRNAPDAKDLVQDSWVPRQLASSRSVVQSRAWPQAACALGHVVGLAGGPHPPPAQLGLASGYRALLPPGTAAERPRISGLPDPTRPGTAVR